MQDIHHQIFSKKFKPSSQANMENFFECLLNEKNVQIKMIICDGTSAGYIVLRKKIYPETVSTHDYRSVFIEHIAVLSEFQGMGLGKRLMEEALSFAKENLIKRVELDVWSENEDAKNFSRLLVFVHTTKTCF